MIDSEQVPRGKGEKHPGEGNEIVSETIYLQGVGAVHGTEIPNYKFQIPNKFQFPNSIFGFW